MICNFMRILFRSYAEQNHADIPNVTGDNITVIYWIEKFHLQLIKQ